MKNKVQWLYCFIFIFFVSNAYAVSFLSTKTEYDSDADGTIDSIYYSTFENCRDIESRRDGNADGIIDSITYTEYDTGKYEYIIRHDHDANGTIDQTLYSWEENSGGEERTITEEDTDGDGTIDSFDCFAYIDNGSSAILKFYQGTGSYNDSGTLTRVVYYSGGFNGNFKKEESDVDADGLIDEVTYTTYDSKCMPILKETDLDNNGTIDQTTQQTHDDKCRPLRTEVYSEFVTYGIETVSKVITQMSYTDDAYGFPVKKATYVKASSTMMGQTIDNESNHISYTTYEYGGGDCGPSSICPCCGNSDQGSSDSDQDSNGSDDASVTQNQVAELYVATFNRAPDAAGLYYWVNGAFGGKATIEQIAESFFDQPETQDLYPAGNSDAEFVNAIYMNLFNRPADAEGLAYWTGPGGLGGGMHRSVMIEALKNGATGSDRAIIDNKTEAGLYFANKGVTGVIFSLSDISDDATTLIAAKAEIDALEVVSD